MNVLQTKTISVSGVYQNDKTFAVLLFRELYKILPSLGLEAELTNSDTDLLIGYKGINRVIFQAKSSTSQISVRGAIIFNNANNGSSNWGSTYNFYTIDSASAATQTFSFNVNVFTFLDGFYIYITDSSGKQAIEPFYSYPARNLVTNDKVYISGKTSSYWPRDVITQSNNYGITYFSGYTDANVLRCVVSDIFLHLSDNMLHYVFLDTYVFCHSMKLNVGQVITIDDETFVCVNVINDRNAIVSKYS